MPDCTRCLSVLSCPRLEFKQKIANVRPMFSCLQDSLNNTQSQTTKKWTWDPAYCHRKRRTVKDVCRSREKMRSGKDSLPKLWSCKQKKPSLLSVEEVKTIQHQVLFNFSSVRWCGFVCEFTYSSLLSNGEKNERHSWDESTACHARPMTHKNRFCSHDHFQTQGNQRGGRRNLGCSGKPAWRTVWSKSWGWAPYPAGGEFRMAKKPRLISEQHMNQVWWMEKRKIYRLGYRARPYIQNQGVGI